MKLLFIKIIFIIIVILIAIGCVNMHFEIFACNKNKEMHIEERSFRVMTYNINAVSENDDFESTKNSIIYSIDKFNPDILCFQEMSSPFFNYIQSSLDSIFGYTDNMSIKKRVSRYLIYSKKNFKNFKGYPCLTEIDSTGLNSVKEEIVKIKQRLPVVSAEIEVSPYRWIIVFAVHLRSSAYTTARRSMDEDASWFDGLPLYYENYKIGQKIRNWEADNLKLHLDSLEVDDIPIIIAGDFNDWSGSYCLNTIRDGKYKDAWWEGGNGLGMTYDGWHLKLRLDHILYSHHFRLENVFVEKSDFSDHRPLVADFTLLP